MVVARGCSLLVLACARAVRRLVQLPALLCCEAMVWALTFLAFPIRLLSAVERERKLHRLMGEMQAQMDDLVWENRDFEERLQAALKEQDAMETILDEMEGEHLDAFARIDALETQLKAVRQKNMRLNENKGKSMWDKATTEAAAAVRHGNNASSEPGKKPAKSTLEAAGGREREEEEAAAEQDAFKFTEPSYLALTTAAPTSLTSEEEEEAVARQAKLVARRRSLFSLGMSLAVGAVAWSADAPCLPLLAGLFAVVGASMCTVSRSCAALRRGGPAADAVALLSLNWFLLGVLTSPMLPGVARAVVPRAGRVLGPALTWLAAATPL